MGWECRTAGEETVGDGDGAGGDKGESDGDGDAAIGNSVGYNLRQCKS